MTPTAGSVGWKTGLGDGDGAVAAIGSGDLTGGGTGLTATAGESGGFGAGLLPGTAPGWATEVAGGLAASGRGGGTQAALAATRRAPIAQGSLVFNVHPPASNAPGIAWRLARRRHLERGVVSIPIAT